MVNPIFGIDVSGLQYLQERVEGTYPTGTYRFIAPELRALWQAQYVPYPVPAVGSPDIADFNVGYRVDGSTFSFDLTGSGVAYLKDAINLGSATTSGAYWSHCYVGRVYSNEDGEVKFWYASGARIDSVALAPATASWRVQVGVMHKPPTITGADPANATYTEWPGAAADPVLNPHTVGSGTLFQWNGTAWYLAGLALAVGNNAAPIPIAGEQNPSKYNRGVRAIDFTAAPYEGDLETYIPALNTVGTGILTLAAGRTVTLGGLYWHGLTELPFDPMRPAIVGLRGTARTATVAG